MKRKYANVGEKVKLLNTLQFIRCGYPLSGREIDLDPELRKRKFELVNKAIEAMFPQAELLQMGVGLNLEFLSIPREDDSIHYSIDARISSKLESAASLAILAEKGWGGKERKVFEEPGEGVYIGSVFEVTKKRFVKTGTRYNSSGGYCTEYSEWDYKPAGLADEQTHCVYELGGWFQTLAKNTERV